MGGLHYLPGLQQTLLSHYDVQHYDAETKQLTRSQVRKAELFLEHGCIRYVGDGKFVCAPLEGYNNTEYTMERDNEWGFNCNCQGFQSKKARKSVSLPVRILHHYIWRFAKENSRRIKMTADDSLLVKNTCAMCRKAEYHAVEIPTFVCGKCTEFHQWEGD